MEELIHCAHCEKDVEEDVVVYVKKEEYSRIYLVTVDVRCKECGVSLMTRTVPVEL